MGRATDSEEVINDRIARAEFELSFAEKFDTIVINDVLDEAKADALAKVKAFLAKWSVLQFLVVPLIPFITDISA